MGRRIRRIKATRWQAIVQRLEDRGRGEEWKILTQLAQEDGGRSEGGPKEVCVDGKRTRQKKEIVKAFKSHFAEVLNVGSYSIPQHILDGILPGTTEEKMAEAPSLKEVERECHQQT